MLACQPSHPVRHLLAGPELLGILGIKKQHRMEVSVTNMADNRTRQSVVDDVLLGLGEDGGQGGDGDADVCGDGPAARPESDVGVVAIVPGCPQSAPLLRLQGELELPGALEAGQLAHCLTLLLHLGLRAVELWTGES